MRRKIESRLVEWKNLRADRRPLLLYGARQVGKTYILDDFGEKNYQNTVYVNLETNLAVANYFDDDISPHRIIRYLETVVNAEILPGETLIVFDEIQSCERAMTSLKYFCENAPEYHVAAAGSLLGVALKRERFSFPVGKVESMTLYPLDFEEFLWALGEERLSSEIRACFSDMSPMPDALHRKAIEYYRIYLIVGGMPACVSAYERHKKTILVPNVQNEILSNYVGDMAKYTEPSEVVKIRACFDSIPAQLAKENHKFQYKVVQKGGSASLFGASIDWLIQAGIVLKCHRLEHAVIPIPVYEDLSSFKLYMGDVGLLAMKSSVPQQTILGGDSNQFMGAVTENYIAQALVSNGHPIMYWTSGNTAELDFVLQMGTDIVGVEVKKGMKTHSRSLGVFASKYHPAYCIRFSEKNFGKEDGLLSIPHYAAFCL
ncbi:MAG: ATP-binding protein [Lachnospiraceae bacterium]|jgi:predicted AAA+ superfamily ATPase|nr:ATP-binding protein [Lachnospiraceae bacterium]